MVKFKIDEEVEAALRRADKLCRRDPEGERIAFLPAGSARDVHRQHVLTSFALGALADEVRRLRAIKSPGAQSRRRLARRTNS